MSVKVDAREIRCLLQDRLDELLAQILPGGQRKGATYVVRNPTRNDARAGSFIVWLSGAARGGFRDYATGESGDVIDLCAYASGRGDDRKFAFDFAHDFLGLRKMRPNDLKAARVKAGEAARRAEAEASARSRAKRVRAQEIWMQCRQAIEDSVAETYLASREIPLALVEHREFDLRFHPRLEYWHGAQWDADRKVTPGPNLPAMVAAIRNLAGDVTAIHCTFLRADGSAKADVEKPKLMLGEVRGSVIRIARGEGNLTCEEAALCGARQTLVVTEGVEDALSVALALPQMRVWAATSLGNLGNAPVHHACVRDVVVAADNDWDKPQAAEALDRAIEALAVHGVPVAVMRAHEGKDFNDLLTGMM